MELTTGLIEQLAEILTAPTAQVLFYLAAAREERKQDTLTISQVTLAICTGVTRNQARAALKKLSALSLIRCETTKLRTIIHIENIQSILNPVKNSPKSVQPITRIPPIHLDTHPVKSVTGSFEQFFEEIWKRYPRKDGKKESKRHFLAHVKTPEDWAQINKALDHYLEFIKSENMELRYVKNGSTWFNNWRDSLEGHKLQMPAPPPKPAPVPRAPEPEPTMTPEEMIRIREANLKKKSEKIPVEDVNALVLKLAGGDRRVES